MLICGLGIEAMAFTLAGAGVYGFDGSVSQWKRSRTLLAVSLFETGSISKPGQSVSRSLL